MVTRSVTGEYGIDASVIEESPDHSPLQELLSEIYGKRLDFEWLKRLQEEVVRVTTRDALTGLPNRAAFTRHVGNAIARKNRERDYHFAILFLDLDRFRKVNDSLGYEKGDLLLQEVSQRLKGCLGKTDLASRFGGDQFAIILDDVEHVSHATQVAERINDEINFPFILDGQAAFMTASVGISLSASGYDCPREMLRDADTAMYRAKSDGGADQAVFDRTMRELAVERQKIEKELRWAVDSEAFQVLYQPIVELNSGLISGFEALVRWQHPERGTICPDEFISIAEETGLIISIGRWVLRQACLQMQRWHQQFSPPSPLTLSVNLSSKELMQADLLLHIDTVLAESGLAPFCLDLEITESAIIENDVVAASAFHELRSRGIRLSIDDFGMGYSSLSYLHRFAFDTLKIDRSFVQRLGDGTESSDAFVQTIVSLAQTLGMELVAEGVETKHQLEKLRRLQCNFCQGYLFSKPVDSTTAERLLAAESPPDLSPSQVASANSPVVGPGRDEQH